MDLGALCVLVDLALETDEPQELHGWTVEVDLDEAGDVAQVAIDIPLAELYVQHDDDLGHLDRDVYVPGIRALLTGHPRLRWVDAHPGEETETQVYRVRRV